MTTLNSPLIRNLLERLYEKAEQTDRQILPQARVDAARLGGPLDDRNHVDLLDRAYIPVAPETGCLLYTLVRARRPETAVEFGTAFGLSTIHIAAALRDNGMGKLIATELNPNKTSQARANLGEAGLDDLVEIRQGDAFETLSSVTGIDFLLLDSWKALYLPMLKKLEPVLNTGCLIVADDLKIMPEMLAPYLAYVRDSNNGYTSVELPLDDGLELSMRNEH